MCEKKDTPQDSKNDTRPFRPNVGCIVRHKSGKIWAGQRLDSSESYWQMPQGGIDDGETPEQAVYREMHEEIGLLAQDVHLLKADSDWVYYRLPHAVSLKMWGGKYQGQRQKWFLFELLSDDTAISIDMPNPEFKAWQWRTPEEIIEHAIPFKKEVYRDVFTKLGVIATS